MNSILKKVLLLICSYLIVGGSFSYANEPEVCISNQESIASEFLGSLFDPDETGSLNITLVGFKEDGTLKNSLVEYYCDTWLQTHDKAGYDIPDITHACVDSGTMRYDPKQSLFMYGLCVGYDESHKGNNPLKTAKKDEYVYRNRKKKFEDLSYEIKTGEGEKTKKISEDISKYIPSDSDEKDLLTKRRGLDANDDPCIPEKGMTNCLMGFPTTNILTTIFAGLFDLKKAAIDGYNHGTTDKDIELAIKDFSIALFDQVGPSNTNGICNDKNKQFLMPKDAGSSDKQSHCGHFQTWGVVKGRIQAAIKEVDRVKELDGHAIAQAECLGLKETMIPCAMSNMEEGTEGKADIIFASEEQAWRNVLLNELFFAGLWIEYYSMIIESEPTRQTGQVGSVLDKNLRTINVEVIPMKRNFAMIEDSVDRSVNLLAQYRSMYHQCISLKAYQEDIHDLTKVGVKMATPVFQLAPLLQDAQEQDK